MSATSGSVLDRLKQVNKELDEPVRPAVTPLDRGALATGAPNAVVGGVQDSPPFRLSKAIRYVAGLYEPGGEDEFKHEVNACRVFKKALGENQFLPNNTEAGRALMLPLCSDYLGEAVTSTDGYRVVKGMMDEAARRYDPDEAAWLANRVRKSQSYLTDNIGGTLVPPPVQGEFIDLMRPKQALVNAGVTQVPLPPNGRVTYPRQTTPSTMYWVGENTAITESQAGTGQVSLQAKKGGVFMTVPNELLKYASVAADALLNADISKTLALGLDYAGLYGAGSFQPTGLVNYTAANQLIAYEGLSPAPKGVATNGNVLRTEDAYRMVGLIEDRNFEFKGWIMRPTVANSVGGYRADAVTAADAAGPLVADIVRSMSDKYPGTMFGGYPVAKSATVRANRSKGSSSVLTEVFGGAWDHMLLGMYGAVELAASKEAGSAFQNDQTYIRGLIWADVALRYEGAFVKYDYVSQAPY